MRSSTERIVLIVKNQGRVGFVRLSASFLGDVGGSQWGAAFSKGVRASRSETMAVSSKSVALCKPFGERTSPLGGSIIPFTTKKSSSLFPPRDDVTVTLRVPNPYLEIYLCLFQGVQEAP